MDLDNLQNVSLEVSAQLGSVRKSVKEILQLGEGSILVLDKDADEPVDVYINNQKFAEGIVMAVDQDYGIKITKIIERGIQQ